MTSEQQMVNLSASIGQIIQKQAESSLCVIMRISIMINYSNMDVIRFKLD